MRIFFISLIVAMSLIGCADNSMGPNNITIDVIVSWSITEAKVYNEDLKFIKVAPCTLSTNKGTKFICQYKQSSQYWLDSFIAEKEGQTWYVGQK